jgi:hypothetical protein
VLYYGAILATDATAFIDTFQNTAARIADRIALRHAEKCRRCRVPRDDKSVPIESVSRVGRAAYQTFYFIEPHEK